MLTAMLANRKYAYDRVKEQMRAEAIKQRETKSRQAISDDRKEQKLIISELVQALKDHDRLDTENERKMAKDKATDIREIRRQGSARSQEAGRSLLEEDQEQNPTLRKAAPEDMVIENSSLNNLDLQGEGEGEEEEEEEGDNPGTATIVLDQQGSAMEIEIDSDELDERQVCPHPR